MRSTLRFKLAIGNSTIEQEVSLAPGSSRLEFHTVVDWHEERKMLRVAFPTSVLTSEATYDIQYGYLKRPTHANTSWDAAKFECCGQRYVDLSDTQNGIALLNDCKYGHRIQGSTIDLGLLRSPKFPDYHADQGRHEFTYALLPHRGALVDSNVGIQAAQLNREPWRFDGLAGQIEAPVSVTGKGVSLEVLKRAEKSDALVIRIVETLGQHSTGTLKLAKSAKLKKVTVTNAIEWTDEGELKPGKDGAYALALKPFQILTLKLQ
ncbi:MAG: alpha-mannosidase [Victivallales bacterium]|nr:alpha-mannosidase [Victivallales bacterium]